MPWVTVAADRYHGGQGGIRTHGTLARTPVFKTGAFDHSATCPLNNAASRGVGHCHLAYRCNTFDFGNQQSICTCGSVNL